MGIYKRRESYTIVETCFYEKFGTELPRLSILQKTKIEQFSDVLKVLEALISCVLEIRPDVARGKGKRTRFASPSNTSIVRSCHYFQALFGRTPSSRLFLSLFVFFFVASGSSDRMISFSFLFSGNVLKSPTAHTNSSYRMMNLFVVC